MRKIVLACVVAVVLSFTVAEQASAWWNCWAPGVCDWIDE